MNKQITIALLINAICSLIVIAILYIFINFLVLPKLGFAMTIGLSIPIVIAWIWANIYSVRQIIMQKELKRTSQMLIERLRKK